MRGCNKSCEDHDTPNCTNNGTIIAGTSSVHIGGYLSTDLQVILVLPFFSRQSCGRTEHDAQNNDDQRIQTA